MAPEETEPVSSPEPAEPDPTEGSGTETLPEATEPAEPSAPADLDLKEANVVDVRFEDLGGGSYRFHVTLLHDDDGEAPNFADWWQVEDPEGNELGKRILLHSHSTAPFTRSEVVLIPPNVDQVIVRGHDMTHGFGGQSMRVDMATGNATPFDEGPDPEG